MSETDEKRSGKELVKMKKLIAVLFAVMMMITAVSAVAEAPLAGGWTPSAEVLELTDKIVHESKMTALMITHNMSDALKYGNRLIMFAHGHIVLDVSGEEKKKMTVQDLYNLFQVHNSI